MTANALATQVNRGHVGNHVWYFVPAPNLQLAVKYALER